MVSILPDAYKNITLLEHAANSRTNLQYR